MKTISELITHGFDTRLGHLSIRQELGKGKSGYSYLAGLDGRLLVLKLMHYEANAYYAFGDSKKVRLEVDAYHHLKKYGIRIPGLLDSDVDKDYLVKEYIDGPTAGQLIADNRITETIIEQLFGMSRQAQNAGINIDYFPSNFVIQDDRLFYIDYEYNPYMREWDLPNWGIYYWANPDGFREFLLSGDATFINQASGSGIPIKTPFEKKVAAWIGKFS